MSSNKQTGGSRSGSTPARLSRRHPGIAEMHMHIAESLELEVTF